MISNFVIDPPWPQKKIVRKVRPNQTENLDYPTLSIEEIFSLLDNNILCLAELNHNVFLWSIDKFLAEVEDQMAQRGYRIHTRFIWDKGNGVAPAFTVRFSHEYMIWFYKEKFSPIAKEYRGKFRTVMQSPGRQHSRKPDCAYDMIEKLYPTSTYMDVFSREKRTGWEQYGDEVEYF